MFNFPTIKTHDNAQNEQKIDILLETQTTSTALEIPTPSLELTPIRLTHEGRTFSYLKDLGFNLLEKVYQFAPYPTFGTKAQPGKAIYRNADIQKEMDEFIFLEVTEEKQQNLEQGNLIEIKNEIAEEQEDICPQLGVENDQINNNDLEDDALFLKQLDETLKSAKKNIEKHQAADSDSLNFRSNKMKNLLAMQPTFDSATNTIKIAGYRYKVIDSTVNDFAGLKPESLPLVSCGSSNTREIIMLDYKHSRFLQKVYADFESMLNKKLGDKQISPMNLCRQTKGFITYSVFPRQSDLVKKVDEYVENKGKDPRVIKFGPHPCIPLERFIGHGIGVCRHHALLACFLMDRYLQSNPDKCSFKGKLQIMRNEVTGGAHAWVTLVAGKDQYYCLDTLNNVYGDLLNPEFQTRIKNLWGEKAVTNQLKKAKLLENRYSSEFNTTSF